MGRCSVGDGKETRNRRERSPFSERGGTGYRQNDELRQRLLSKSSEIDMMKQMKAKDAFKGA
jgi:hypothetical protein